MSDEISQLCFTYKNYNFVRKLKPMNTKLTLSIDEDIIQRAKLYARDNNVSLSFIVENYLLKIISEYQEKPHLKGSIVNELSGIIQLSADVDYKEEYTDYLTKKYD